VRQETRDVTYRLAVFSVLCKVRRDKGSDAMKAFVMKDIGSLASMEKPVPRTDLTPPTPVISAWVSSSIFHASNGASAWKTKRVDPTVMTSHTLHVEAADKKPITF
jgi:hypothetical protein